LEARQAEDLTGLISMSEKSEKKVTLIISLRDARRAPVAKRTNVSMRKLREIVLRQTKASRVMIDEDVNSAMWAHSSKRPLRRLRLEVSIEDDMAHVSLPSKENRKEQ